MNLAESTLKIILAKIINVIGVFAGVTYFARSLTPEEFGVFFLFQVTLGISTLIADLGLRGGITKRLSEGNESAIIAGIILKILPVIVICVLILSITSRINSYIGASVSNLLIIGIIIYEISYLSIHILDGELRVGETAILRAIPNLTWFVFGYILLEIGYGLKSIIYSLLLGYLISSIIGLYKANITIYVPKYNDFKSIIEYSKYYAITYSGGYVYNWLDVAIIGLILSQSAVSIYEISWRITTVVAIVGSSISIVLFPQISDWDAEEQIHEIETTIPKAISGAVVFVIPAFFGSLLLAEDILQYIFDTEYILGAIVVSILMFEKVFQSIDKVLRSILQGINKPNYTARATVIAIFLNVSLNFVFIPTYGIEGAAIATTISFIINTLLHIFYLSREINISVDWKDIFIFMIASIMMIGVVQVYLITIGINGTIDLLLGILVGVVVYVLQIILIPSIRHKAQNIIPKI
jgi:O-antigen/teichoic acid export membrane protein